MKSWALTAGTTTALSVSPLSLALTRTAGPQAAVVRNGRTWNGVPTSMVAFPQTSADPKVLAISDADLAAVLTWLGTAPKPTTGPGLYKDFCGNCHGPTTGTGGIVPISIIGKTRAEITQKVRMGEGTDKTMRNLFMPPHTAMELTDAELGMIMDYVMAAP